MSIQCPLRLLPILVPKVWGGDALRQFVDPAEADWPSGEPVGEVWVCSDQGEQSSVVAGGSFGGRTLSGLMLSEREALVGEGQLGARDSFPLLLKLLDAQANLSVQVHPDHKAAQALGADSKDECWYIVHAEPRAEIFVGLGQDVDATRFASGAQTHEVVDLLQRHTVRSGDGVFVPSGTVHSIGAGIAIVEVQTNSDTTYRVYDWGRMGLDGKPRKTHIDEALHSIDFRREVEVPGPLKFRECPSGADRSQGESDSAVESHETPAATASDAVESDRNRPSVNRIATLADCSQFVAEVMEVHEPVEMTVEALPTVVVVLAGNGRLDTGDGETYSLSKGGAWVLPADLTSARVVEADGDLRLLRARPARAN